MRKIDRLAKYMTFKGLNDNQVTKDCGLSQGLLGQARSGKSDLGQRTIDKILIKYQDLSRVWLLTGEGEMLRRSDSQPTIVSDTIRSYSTLSDAKGTAMAIPFVGREIATAPDLDVRQLIEERGHTLEEFPFYKMVKGVDYIQTVITMAMAPRYLPGDYLFVHFRDGNILSGKIYLVDTRQYGTMLRHVYIEDGGYTLKASNPEFKSVFVRSEDVYSISSVILSVNTNTSLTSEINLAELVRQRDTQIQTITEVNSSMIEQQRELISEIRKQNDRLDRERESRDRLTDYIISKKV